MTGDIVPKRKGRPPGAKNKRKPNPVVYKALNDMGNEFVEACYKFLSADLDKLPKPRTAMDRLVLNTFQRATDPGDQYGHHFSKLLFERAIPQRKQIEHLGEMDASRLGVNINVHTERAEKGVTIDHEPLNGDQKTVQ
jgi:hypothetical protein